MITQDPQIRERRRPAGRAKFEIVLSAVFTLAGMGALLQTYSNLYSASRSPAKPTLATFIKTKATIELPSVTRQFVKAEEEKSAYWALFVVPAGSCPPVFNEIQEYYQILRGKTDVNSLRQVLVLLTQDSHDPVRFEAVNDISTLDAIAAVDSPAEIEKLTRYGERGIARQLLLFDPKNSTVLFRAPLSSSETSMAEKADIVAQMLGGAP